MRGRRTDEGAAAVEFALVLPFLLVLLCGIVDFGLAFNAKVTLTHAAREGVRAIALGETADDTTDGTTCATPAEGPRCRTEAAATGLDIFKLSVEPTLCPVPAPSTDAPNATLLARYDYEYVTPLGALMSLLPGSTSTIGKSVELTATGVMRCGG